MDVGRHCGKMTKEDIMLDSNYYEKVTTSHYLGSLLINQNSF